MPLGHYGEAVVAIVAFLALMMLGPIWRVVTGARLARSRALEVGAPVWIAWLVGVLGGGAVLVGAFLGGAGSSIWKSVATGVLAVVIGGYLMWRAGFRRVG